MFAERCLTILGSEKLQYFVYDSLNPFPSSTSWEAPCFDNTPGIQKSLKINKMLKWTNVIILVSHLLGSILAARVSDLYVLTNLSNCL